MPNTYTQIHIQTVFTVQNKHCIIHKSWQEELYKYLTGIIHNNGHKVLAVNGMPDHVHILFGFRPTQALSALMQDVKAGSSKWINQSKLVAGKFSWQEGYGAFSYSKSHVENVIHYIRNQQKHHKRRTFIEEYLDFLEKFDVPFDEKYIFKPVDYCL